ncbi:DNA polymerase III subunit delta' [Geobacillus genomosp. 3]|uniref:DNA polymerase III subunit delta n=1 Tax=Geobacillus genomosp. 3 TaxID=1921421 RepID=S5ZZF7_GEOG3|nr:DNA polymerase III subunit delta' [Geobacillus genomosp. 3]AGT30486.2 DNA polymerase III subunit delta' [Geobacillus genomosp. 3]
MAMRWEQLAKRQPVVAKMLQSGLEKGRISHAYLFEGQRGTGKKAASLLLAKSLFCLSPSGIAPCLECRNCRRIDSGNHPDVRLISPDGGSIKKEQIEWLQQEFTKTAVESDKKMYIVEHADQMTTSAANSLLKFLEEPYPGTVAVLLTEQYHRLLRTVVSRCQVFSFRPLPPTELAGQLVEERVPPALALLAAHLTNSYDEALALSQDRWFAEARTLVLQLYEMLGKPALQLLFFIHDRLFPHFPEKYQLDLGLDLLLYIYRDLLHIQAGRMDSALYQDELDRLQRWALSCPQRRILDSMDAILQAKARLNTTNMSTALLMEQLALQLKR